MVAKISSNNSLFGTLLYNSKKIEAGEAELLSSRNVYERADGSFSMQTTIKSFEPYLVANKRTEKAIFHVSLNPSPKDKLTDDEFREIADQYMKDMGYENQPYVVFKHADIDRIHLHVVSVRVDENGKKLDSNFENKRSMKICRQIESDFKLTPATKQEEQTDYVAPTKPINYKEGDIKSQIGNITKSIMNNYNFQSIGEYRTLLEIFNVSVEELKGVKNGNPYQGLLYSAMDDKNQKVGVPIKASKIGKSVGYDALQKKFEKSKMKIEKDKVRENLRSIIKKVMSESTSLEGFKKRLLANKVNPILRVNADGKLYGVSFIDYQRKSILNGSRLGKEFSANVLNERFSQPKGAKSENANNIQAEEIQNFGNDDFSLGLSLFEVHGEDWENENFVRRKKKVELNKRKLNRRKL
mgnify:CR=1 FL=1